MDVKESSQGGLSRDPTTGTDVCAEASPCSGKLGAQAPAGPTGQIGDGLHSDVSVEQYVAQCLERGEAPIKREYARLVCSQVPYHLHVGGAETDVPAVVGVRVDTSSSKGRIEKNRQHAMRDAERRLCSKVAQGLVCQYGDACKFTHDVDAYLRDKPDDLVGRCPWSSQDGEKAAVCPYGVCCRFYGAHDGNAVVAADGTDGVDTINIDAVDATRTVGDGRFWIDDGTVPRGRMLVVDVGRRVLRPLNDLERDVRMALRKKMYDFGRVEVALRDLEIKDSKKVANKCRRSNGSGKRKAGGGDPGDDDGEDGDGAVKVREGCVEDGAGRKGRDYAKKVFDARGKTYLAPLTTVGNLPFRRLCKRFGADITCGEMAMGQNLMQGQPNEWALLKRHPEEDFFGVQVCGAHADTMAYCAQLIEENCEVDFVDINCGCPIDMVVDKGAGSAVLTKPKKLEEIVRGMTSMLTCPVTVKMRRGFDDRRDLAHKLIPRLASWGASAVVLHGRTRKQRYSRPADWDYIRMAASLSDESCQVIGNGDVFGWQDHVNALESGDVATTYVARGALIKPWIFTEIKERRDWDISAGERLDIVRQYVRNGLEVRWLI